MGHDQVVGRKDKKNKKYGRRLGGPKKGGKVEIEKKPKGPSRGNWKTGEIREIPLGEVSKNFKALLSQGGAKTKRGLGT